MIVEIDAEEIERQVRHFMDELEPDEEGKGVTLPLLVTLRCHKLDIIRWLQSIEQTPKVYWASRDGKLEIGGAGATMLISGTAADKYRLIENILQASPVNRHLCFLGGADFYPLPRRGNDWHHFLPVWFVLPEFLLQRHDEEYSLSISTLYRPEMTRKELTRILIDHYKKQSAATMQAQEFYLPRVIARCDLPDYSGWTQNIQKSLQLIESGQIQKVVLARKTTLTFTAPVDGLAVLDSSRQRNQNCFVYFFQPVADAVFLGATPERLLQFEHGVLTSEAVSGTIPRQNSPQKDRRCGEELLHSEKNLNEHRFVVAAIQNIFESICSEVECQTQPTLLKLANVQHLYSKISGSLTTATSLTEIITAMQPTPAVGGTPREQALTLIQQLEQFDRGWYAGPVGVISQNRVEMVIALRSLLLAGRQAHLYAGAGIVAGSEPELEWQELESKIAVVVQLFGGEAN